MDEGYDSYFFEDVVATHTGADFVDRRWLEAEIESALNDDSCRYVLLTAEPGAGKTCLVAGMAKRWTDRPRYFARRDSRAPLTGGDAQSFLLSVGHQLASIHPELFQLDSLDIEVRQRVEAVLTGGRAVGLRIEDLTASPFHGTALLRLEQTAAHVEGTLVGVEIGHANLEPRLLEPDNLTHLALIAPAAVLAVREPTARIVVLVDALDEVADQVGGGGLLEWLESGPELPANVRLVLTSRTHTKLELFRQRRVGQVTEFFIDPQSSRVRADLVAYAERVMSADAVTQAVESQGMVPEELAEAVAIRAEGNFAYLVAYGRALVEAIERLDDDFRNRLLRFSDVPLGLDSLYGFFMESIRNDISRLGMMVVREPLSPQDTLCPAWESVGQPVLGILVVAREVLTLDQIIRLSRVRVWRRDVANVIARLRQFLDTTPDGVRLFHSSLAEFLLSEQSRALHPEWAVEEQEWHERIVLCYRNGAPNWEQVDWSTVDQYGLRNIAAHLSRCRRHLADEVIELVNPGLRRALRSAVGSDREFLAVTELAAQRAVNHFPASRALPTVLFLGIVSRQVTSVGTRVPPEVVGLLSRLGRVDEALDYVRLLPPSEQQFEGLRAVLRHSSAEHLEEQRRQELVGLLVQYALAVPPQRQTMGTTLEQRRKAVEAAAVELAPYNLARALRLTALSRTIVADELRRDDEVPAEDAVYRAAALAAAPDRAGELIASMQSGRASAYLDLADRAALDELRLADLLKLAESSLPTEAPESRLVCQARLAAQWLPIDAEASHRQVAAVGRGVARPLAGDSPTELDRWRSTCVDAVAHLATADAAAARDLLERFDGITHRPTLAAAKLWAQWGDTHRCRRLLDALLDDSTRNRSPDSDELAAIAAVVAMLDPERARHILDRAAQQIQPASGADDPITGVFHDRTLAHVARVMAPLSPERALGLVLQISEREWGGLGTDRASAIADMAHAHLDAGQVDRAVNLLEICLADVGAPLPLELPDLPAGVPFRVATGARPSTDLRDTMFLNGYTVNAYNEWLRRCRRRLFLEPADVARAALPLPYADGATYSWDRTLRALAETVGRHRIDIAEKLLGQVADAAERAIGQAGLGVHAQGAGDPDTARRLLTAAMVALHECQRFEWKFDRTAAVDFFNRHKQTVWSAPGYASRPVEQDTEDVLAYLLPDQRARFEVAVRCCLIGADGGTNMDSPFLLRACYSNLLCAKSQQQLDQVEPGAQWPAEAIAFHHEHAVAKGRRDDPLTRVTLARLVAAERILRHRGTHDSQGKRRPVSPMRPLTVPDPVYAGVAHLLSVRAGLPVADRLVGLVRDLLTTDRLLEVAHLASLTAAALADTDADGARALATETTATIRRCEDSFTRALALARLAEPAELANLIDTATLVDEAAKELDGMLSATHRDELLAVLFPIMVSTRPAAAALQLLTALRTDWREAMALLEWAGTALVDTYGIDIVEQFAAAFTRAQNFCR